MLVTINSALPRLTDSPCDDRGMSRPTTEASALERVKSLAFWQGPVAPVRVYGGITNINYKVVDAGKSYFVRVGDDIAVHHILRFNERAATAAAHAAGISPELVHAEPGVMIMRFIEGHTCTADDIRDPARLARAIQLVKRVHREIPQHITGPVLAFWVFYVIRDYVRTLDGAGSRYQSRLAELSDIADGLELAVGPVDFVFAHNDLLPGNFIDDGQRLWLIDWDYGGFNAPLFDLANLASNSNFDRAQEEWLLHTYYGRNPDDRLLASFDAMKCASLMREVMWSMVSEIYSTIDFDYAAYTADYMDRFARAYASYRMAHG
jgi:thiamine kinase-like enzyme